jgi:DNA-binding transcriptional MerR regulator
MVYSDAAMYTVKKLADLAGVTTRALRHYDRIGLLKPTSVGANGYRYYGEPALYRLQQVMFFRELGMPLKDIKAMLGRRDFDMLAALASHRSALQAQARRLRRLIRTIDVTLQHMKGRHPVEAKKLFEGFSEAEQAKLAGEAAKRWDPTIVRASNERWKKYSPAERKEILDEGNSLYANLAAAMPKGAASREVQRLIGRWHDHMQHFWSPSDEQLLALAELYNEDPRFRKNYEDFTPGLASFMRAAVGIYVERRKR